MKEMSAAAAARDFDKVSSHILTKTDSEKETIGMVMAMLKASAELDEACKAKFGKDLSALMAESQSPGVKGNPMLSMMSGKAMAKALGSTDPAELDKATIKPLSPTGAEVTEGEGPKTKLVKDGGLWKVPLSGAMGSIPPGIGPMLKAMGGAYGEVAASTKAGKYAKPDDMLTELSAKVMGAAMGGMGGPKPKPGGGGGNGGAAGVVVGVVDLPPLRRLVFRPICPPHTPSGALAPGEIDRRDRL